MDMNTAWPAYLIGAVVGFVGLEIYAKVTGKPTLTQWIRERVGAHEPAPQPGQPRRVNWRLLISAPLGGVILSWLWVHLFTKWL
jgi:hypothetical protein